MPSAARFGFGACVLSLTIFALLLGGVASVWTLAAAGVASLLPALWFRPRLPPRSRAGSWDAATWVFAAIALVYAALYLVHAAAPEIQPDGARYHLALVCEWLRLGGFPERIGFYEVLPQGIEMLFLPAYAIGGASAAKFVHFAFLAASVPLLLDIGKRLELPVWAGPAAAVLYACAPVTGIAGTSAYNDAALVFFAMLTFHALLVWHGRPSAWLMALAGLAAGFCYAVKPTGLVIPAGAVMFLLARRHWRAVAVFSTAAAVMMAPWLVRNAVWTGNPVAPLLNGVFENPYFTASLDASLGQHLRSYGGVTPVALPWEITVVGVRTQGFIGLAFLLAPLALLALRRPAGRLLLLATLVAAVPLAGNFGARFLMPALPFLALALMAVLPRRAALAVAAAHAVLCLPPVMDLYVARDAWRLRGVPVAAALRIEDEETYLRRTLGGEFAVAELVRDAVAPGRRVLDFHGAPSAYFDAVAVAPWHSSLAARMADVLQLGGMTGRGVYTELHGGWKPQPLTALRLRATEDDERNWSVQDVRLFNGAEQIRRRPNWRASAWPNVWDAPYAFDESLLTRWSAGQPARAGMHVQISFPEPTTVDRAVVVVRGHEQQRIEFVGQTPDGRWLLLEKDPDAVMHPPVNLRRSAARILMANGFGYVLIPRHDPRYAELARGLAEESLEWGVEVAGEAAGVCLLRIR